MTSIAFAPDLQNHSGQEPTNSARTSKVIDDTIWTIQILGDGAPK